MRCAARARAVRGGAALARRGRRGDRALACRCARPTSSPSACGSIRSTTCSRGSTRSRARRAISSSSGCPAARAPRARRSRRPMPSRSIRSRSEGARCAWSYEVLANDRPIRHTEMEYSLPIDARRRVLRRAARADRARLPRAALAARVPHARGRRSLALDGERARDRHDLGPPGRRRTRRAAVPRLRGDLRRARRAAALGQGPLPQRTPSSRRSTRAGATGGARAIASTPTGSSSARISIAAARRERVCCRVREPAHRAEARRTSRRP